MARYDSNFIKAQMKKHRWDRTVFKHKVVAECIQQGVTIPSDMTIDRWRKGISEPGFVYLTILATVLNTDKEKFYV